MEEPRSRYPFSVDRFGDKAIVSMYIGRVVRSRYMSLDLLQTVGELCRQLLKAGKEIKPEDDDVPSFSRFLVGPKGEITGVCHAKLGFHRLNGKVETVIAIYDEGDDTAPVLILVEDQIDEFIRMT